MVNYTIEKIKAWMFRGSLCPVMCVTLVTRKLYLQTTSKPERVDTTSAAYGMEVSTEKSKIMTIATVEKQPFSISVGSPMY